METKKIAVACFVGGVLCCGATLLLTPTFWWLGIIAGLAGGYISYEFREVLNAIPIALRAKREVLNDLIAEVREPIKKWRAKRHTFFSLGMIMSVPITYVHPKDFDIIFSSLPAEIAYTAFCSILTFVAIIVFSYLFGWILGDFTYFSIYIMTDDAKFQEKWILACHHGEVTYQEVLFWVVVGIGIIIYFFLWEMWKHIIHGIWAAICFICRFACNLFKLIHSEKRLLCAIDGTLGGTASYIWATSAPRSFTELIIFVIFGGLIGAALGVANWEIVSKRILHLPANNIST
jgi:hypothetical protein